MIIVIGLCAVVATMIGGLFALRFKDHLHLILGFSAGAVVGVAFFDLLPESIELIGSENTSLATLMIALGFVFYLIIDRALSLHSHGQDDCDHAGHHHHQRGLLGAVSISIHSLLDGMAIGFAFQVSPGIGWIVAAAVLAHNFSDGLNTVGLVLKNTASRGRAFRWLLVDALAPLAGIILTFFIRLPEQTVGMVLAVFTGFFLYLGASDLLPESHHQHPTVWTTVATIFGISVLYAATSIAGL